MLPLSLITSLGLAVFVPGCLNFEEVDTTVDPISLSYMMGDYDGNNNAIQIELEDTVSLGYTAFAIRWRNDSEPAPGQMEDLYIYSMQPNSDVITVYEKTTTTGHPTTSDGSTHKGEMVSREVNRTSTKYTFNIFDLPRDLQAGDVVDFAIAYGVGSPPDSMMYHTNRESISVTLRCEVAVRTETLTLLPTGTPTLMATDTVSIKQRTATVTATNTPVTSTVHVVPTATATTSSTAKTVTESLKQKSETLLPTSTSTFTKKEVSVTSTMTATPRTETAVPTSTVSLVQSVTETLSKIIVPSTATLPSATVLPSTTAIVQEPIPTRTATETLTSVVSEINTNTKTATMKLPRTRTVTPTIRVLPPLPDDVILVLEGCVVYDVVFNGPVITSKMRNVLGNHIVDMTTVGIVVTPTIAEDRVSGVLRDIPINVTISGTATEVVHEVASVIKQYDTTMDLKYVTVSQISASTSKKEYLWVWYILAAGVAVGCAFGVGGYVMGCGKDTRVKALDGLEQGPAPAQRRTIEQQLGLQAADEEEDDEPEDQSKPPPMIPQMNQGLAATFEKLKKSPAASSTNLHEIMADRTVVATPRSHKEEEEETDGVSPRRRKSSSKEKKRKKEKKDKRRKSRKSSAMTDAEDEESPHVEVAVLEDENSPGESGADETREERRRRKKAQRREREKDDPDARERRKAKKASKKARKASHAEDDGEESPKAEKRRKSKDHKKEKRRKSRKAADADDEEVVIE